MKRKNYQWYFTDRQWQTADEEESENKEYKIDLKNLHGEHMLYVDDKKIGKINKGKCDLFNYDYKFNVDGHECVICNWPAISTWGVSKENVELYIDGYPCYATKDDYASSPFPGVIRKDYFGFFFLVFSTICFVVTIASYAIMSIKRQHFNYAYLLFVFASLISIKALCALYRRPVYEKKVITSKYETITQEGSVKIVWYWFVQLFLTAVVFVSAYLLFFAMCKYW